MIFFSVPNNTIQRNGDAEATQNIARIMCECVDSTAQYQQNEIKTRSKSEYNSLVNVLNISVY